MRAAWGLCNWPFNQAALGGPQPLGLDEPLLTAPERPGHTLRWCLHEAHWRFSKESRLRWEDDQNGELKHDRVGGLRLGKSCYTLGGGGGRPSEGSGYDVAHVPPQLLGICHSGEGGGEEILVSCPHVGTFGGRIVMARRGGTVALVPNWAQILGMGQYNPATANKGRYGGKVTGMPRRGGEESSAGQRARRMAGRTER